jgi:hypothetical protein
MIIPTLDRAIIKVAKTAILTLDRVRERVRARNRPNSLKGSFLRLLGNRIIYLEADSFTLDADPCPQNCFRGS